MQESSNTSETTSGAMNATAKAYWRANVRRMAILLAVWAFVSFGCGVLLAPWLNTVKLGGAPLGFWFAQQGAIYVFVALILIYVFVMRRLDKQYDVDE